MTNTTITTQIAKTSTRGRKFNPAKYAINRAWEIAKNAETAHNTNPVDVAIKGLVKASEFFAEALKISWKEAKAKAAKLDFESYELHKVPKKNQKAILNAIDILVTVKAAAGFAPTRLELAEEIFNARFTSPAARSTNRHTLNALPAVVETGMVESDSDVVPSIYIAA